MERQILIPHEVAPRLRCTRRQIYDLFGEGELAGFRVGSHIKIFADSVDDYIRRHSNARPPANEPPGVVALQPAPPNVRPPALRAASPSSRPSPGRQSQPPVGYRYLRPRPASPVGAASGP